ncbi:hypothetical protein [Isoptericola sp. BMS4]|uniref:hypothetical protein n=1 Tax=Isoptericola sp. BMS4 TaxID=2527875 RepID=UPI001424484A|nr:hypothetical protein [Isoptericola sp. BMS4]
MTDDPTAPGHDDLPLPDYDHLSTGELVHRIRALDAAGVEELLTYERAHGDRLPVVTVLEQRIADLRDGAEPSGGDPATAGPGGEPHRAGGKVSPDTAAEPGPPEPYQGTSSQPRG